MSKFVGALVVGWLVAGPVAAQPPQPKPGPEHALLKQMEGEWDATIKLAAEPGKPPMESKGSFSVKLDLGGLFMISNFKGEFAGLAFQGHGVVGYDPVKKKYTGFWADSMAPTMMTLEGSFDKAGKVYTEIGEGLDPATNKLMKMKMVTEIKDKDNMVFTMNMPGPDGKDATMMTITYKRKK